MPKTRSLPNGVIDGGERPSPWAPDGSGEAAILRRALSLLSEAAGAEAFEQLSRDALAAGLASVEPDLARAAGVAARIAYQKKREGELLGLYDTGRDITALRDTEELLRAIARRARQLVGGDIAYISSLEEEGNVFIVRATEGIVSEGFEAMRVPLGYGLCGQVAATRRPCYATNYLAEKTFNRTASFDKYVKAEGIVSMLGIPLEINTHVIGVLFVGERFARTYTPQEIAVLSSLAALAALAIQNSRLFAEAQTALARERQMNQELSLTAAQIQAASVAHERMIDFIARGGSLDGLASLAAELLDGRVRVFDSQHRPICTVGRIRGCPEDQNPDLESPEWRSLTRDALRESIAVGRSVLRTGAEGIVCRVTAIFGGSDQFGGLLILRHEDMSEAEARTLERGAMVSAILLLSNERMIHAGSRDAYDAVSALLRDPGPGLAAYPGRGREKHPNIRWPLTLMLIELGAIRAGQILPATKAVVGRQGGLVSEYNGDLVVLAQTADPDAIAADLQEAIAQETGLQANIAIAEPAQAAPDLPARYAVVQRSLKMMRALRHEGRVTHERYLAVYSPLFARKEADEIETFIEGSIGPLKRYDGARHNVLIPTLLTFLNSGQRLQKTADLLEIHVNTLRQRLETVANICPGWDDGPRLLITHLALNLHALSGGTA